MKRGNFMNKTNMLKVLLVIMITVGLISMSTEVLADGMLDLSNTLQNGTTTDENTNGNTLLENTNTNDELQDGTNTNDALQNATSVDNQNTNNNADSNANKNTNSNTSSSYAESDIPHAGIETSVLTIAAFIVCAIIGAYTFMRLSDYSNI